VAIIMDGNGRWAQQRGLPRIEGHRKGAESVRRMVEACHEQGIRYLTLFAFSAENWKRPQAEISALMNLLERFLRSESRELVRRQIRLQVIGRPQDLPEAVQRELKAATEATAHFTEWNLVLALNYGSRTEIADAAQAYAMAVAAGKEDPNQCSWERFRRYLYTINLPDPDLVIRTSGETRLSNFLLMQCAYSEMFFSPVLWPDFNKEHFAEAVESYKRRERRFGRTGEQVANPEPAFTLL
jgi:undecaprenyl diphosphate synthase